VTLDGSMKYQFTIARYNADGSLDMSFGPADTGFVSADLSPATDDLEDIAVSPDGNITAVGDSGLDAALARWDSDGALNPSFDGPAGTGNGMFVDPVVAGLDDYRDVEVEPSGAVRAVGVASTGPEANWLVGRYTPTGARDTGFNGSGPGSAAERNVAPPSLQALRGGPRRHSNRTPQARTQSRRQMPPTLTGEPQQTRPLRR
jgi:uncharacterized delta-60 repeat protein